MRLLSPPPVPDPRWTSHVAWIDRYGECKLPVIHVRKSLLVMLMISASVFCLYGWFNGWGDPDVYREVFGRRMGLRAAIGFGLPGLVGNVLLIAVWLACLRTFAQTWFKIRVAGVTVRPFGLHLPADAIDGISEPTYWYKGMWTIFVRRRHRRWFEFPCVV